MRAGVYELLRGIVQSFPHLRGIGRTPLGIAIRKHLVRPPPLANADDMAFFPPPLNYETYRRARIEECRSLYPDVREKGLLSFITTVWNTDAIFLDALAQSLANQQGGLAGVEWLILDNGSTKEETLRCFEKLKSLPFVRLERVDENLGIIGGMRYVLERARNRYVLPLDSDDLLYPQCVSILVNAVRAHRYPPLLYSDEDKVDHNGYRDAYHKPDWDPVLFVHSCYIAHLCAIDRQLALSLGAYDDPEMEGCHDWDTFMRFYRAGHSPVHVPEVLYSWRIHQQSTSGNIDSKSFIHNSHVALQNKFLATAGMSTKYRVNHSPLFNKTPDWRFQRLDGATPPLRTILMTDARHGTREPGRPAGFPNWDCAIAALSEGTGALRRSAAPLAQTGGLVHLLWDQVEEQGNDGALEALQFFELFPDTAMVGGRVWSPSLEIVAAGSYFGFGQGCDTPDRRRPRADPGFFAQMWKPHSVSAVSSQLLVVDAAFLVAALDRLAVRGAPATPAYLGAWLGTEARRQGRRVVYTPFLAGRARVDWEARISDEERRAFVSLSTDVIPETQFLSPRLGLDPSAAYTAVDEKRRRSHLARIGLTKDRFVPAHSAPQPTAAPSTFQTS